MDRSNLISSIDGESYDLIVIGGGSAGAGVFFDAVNRGYKTLLLDQKDFAEGSSGRCSKLLHGGVRYLEKAVKNLDYENFTLVLEGLKERGIVLNNYPNASRPLEFVTPTGGLFSTGYIFMGLALYDMLAGKRKLSSSKALSKKSVLERFPNLNKSIFKNGVSYYDGQFVDTRLCLDLIFDAVEQGGLALNHSDVVELSYEYNKVNGVVFKDQLTGHRHRAYANAVVNATGIFADNLRLPSDDTLKPFMTTSSGLHIVISGEGFNMDCALMIPETEDGRVLFILPWEGHIVVGTTDNEADIEHNPLPLESDVQYLLKYLNHYLEANYTEDDILSKWVGLRPLVVPNSNKTKETQEVARTHVIEVSSTGLVTIAGGKWTSYRRMAEETLDRAILESGLEQRPCNTETRAVRGGRDFDPEGYRKLATKYNLDQDIAKHLNRYGEKMSHQILDFSDNHSRLADGFPYIISEIEYFVEHEMAVKPMDILARRTLLALLNTKVALDSLDKVADIMARKMSWTDEEKSTNISEAKELLTRGF